MKTIGVLTSGGDCPGMNACIRAIVRCAASRGMRVYGINRGYQGMLEGDIELLDVMSVSGMSAKGGTFIQTARCVDFKTKEGRARAAEQLKKFGIEGLVVCGGDGSFSGAKLLCEEHGVPCIGIPGTIDNDLAYTDFTMGFDTSVNTAINAIHNVIDTMASHNRVCVVEVMGRGCGDIALYTAISVGADGVIIPEQTANLEEIADRIRKTRTLGKRYNIVVLAEGCGHAAEYVVKLEKLLPEYSIRGTDLGHVIRGGAPTMYDRIFAGKAAMHAVELLEKGIGNRVIGIKDNQIFDMDIFEALNMPKTGNDDMYAQYNALVLN
ncbi:MAG: 6-phosphofructokinase [Clostridia bacterium]|nr:6-phosphofructokinase [Clostridia bacterium]